MTTLRLAELPDWPSVMDVATAAAYVSISASSLLGLVGRNRFPQPIRTTDRRRGWRRVDLDAWVAAGGIDGAAKPHTLGGLQGWD